MLDPYEVKERLDYYNRNYLPLSTYHLYKNDKIILGNKDSRVCRFCGKDKTETSFRKIAHALPEFIGNKKLTTYYECDTCNAIFSKLLESQMANYMNIWHTLSHVKGKEGVPSFKSNTKKSRIDFTTEGLTINADESDKIATIDRDKKILQIKVKKASYIPIAIYKCLTKMALSILPEHELVNFKETFKWIKEPTHSNNQLKSLYAFMTVTNTNQYYWFVSCTILKRKAATKESVPYMIFLLAYANYSFQIYLPFCEEDVKHFGQNFQFISFPWPVETDENSKIVIRKTLDLNGCSPVKGEDENIFMTFD